MHRPSKNVRGGCAGGPRGAVLAAVALTLLACVGLTAAVSFARAPSAQGTPSCLGKPATIVGTAGAGELLGGPGRDVISGSAGSDRIDGRGGNDLICAGAGDDMVSGGAGDDRIAGGPGNDLLRGGAGQDRLWGQGGRDRLFGDAADDLLAGGESADRCDGGDGVDKLTSCETAPAESTEIPAGIEKPPAPTVDTPPTAVKDLASVKEGAPATAIPVLANDTDPDAGPKTVASVTQPSHGTAAITSGGLEVTYQPNPGYCNDGEAADSFTYSLNGGSTATAAVSVTCVTEVAISQGLVPEFDPGIPDYTVRCDGSPLDVTGRTAQAEEIAVDGEQPQAGKFQAAVPLEANQEFSFEISGGGAPDTYHVRCLPADFGAWEYERLLPPSHAFYVVTPTLGAGANRYAVIFDDHGVPVWWETENPAPPSDAKVLPDGTIAWWSNTAPHGDDYEIHDLNGNLVKNFFAATGRTDSHDFQETPNGNYLLLSYQPREHVDLTAYGGGPDDSVTDAVIEELTPNNEPVWSWSTQGHIGLAETGRWWPTALASNPRDIVHMNAVEPVGEDAILISLRHTDAVYKIKKSTGEVIWKLGGTWTPKSLTVKGDPEGAYPLGGQHDVRLQPDGTITIHDNNTNLPDPPRAVRYQIDEANKTATLVEEVTDPEAPTSFCCGGARRSADGSWLMSWGGNSLVTEFNSAGQRTFRLGFGGVPFSYRAVPAPEGVLSAAALRAGMDSMHPRP